MIVLTLAQAVPAAPPEPEGFPAGHPFAEMSQYWGSSQHVSWEWLFIGVGAILVMMSLLSLRIWWQTRNERPAPLLAFLQVCAAIDLPWGDRLFLWRIARRERLASPLTLLLSPATLRHHGRSYATGVGLANPAGRLRRVASLRRRLFGDAEGPPAAAETPAARAA